MSTRRVRRSEESTHRDGRKRASGLSPSGSRSWRFFAAAAIVAIVAAGSPAAAQDLEPGQDESRGESALVDSELRDIVDQLARGRAPVDPTILVEVHYLTTSAEARGLVEAAGGTVNGEVEGWLLQARVPIDQLEALEASPAIRYLSIPGESVPIRLPDAPDPGPEQATTGVHVVESNADEWQALGIDGTGVQVGVVDFFNQTDWNAAVASGDLPATSGTFCQDGGVACTIWTPGSTHGNNVSELIHDMAPAADLYIARVGTVSDLQAAVDYFDTQGVDIISRSLTARYDGPGDGTGPIAAVIDDAVSKGMAWFNSAGNNAGSTGNGSYWRGGWADADGDGWLEFAPGDELLGFDCAYVNGVRWSDWGDPNATDYDVYVFDDSAATILLDSSTNSQPAADPLELAESCNDIDFLAIKLFAANGGTAGDVIEFSINGTQIEYSSNPFSASGPASDTANAGAMSVGAIDPATGNTIASYSSRGPTNDNRIKPDMSAQACIATSLSGCFNGTSASTPVLAGAAALVLDSGEATTPAGIRSYLLNNAAVDRGVAGDDNTYGAGELLLPSPGQAICPPDDAFEDNDTQATATGLANGVGVSGIACDDDWFSLPVPAGADITADALFSDAAGDIDMTLHDPTGTTVEFGTSTTDDESITHTAAMTGAYAVKVYGFNGAQNTYDLTVSAALCPPDDGFEDNDTQATAAGLTSGVGISGRACDDDWFSLPVTAGANIAADALFSHAGGDIDMTLHDPTGTAVEGGFSVTDDESITHAAAMTGDYAVRVYGFSGAQNIYDLTVSTAGGSTCDGLPVTVDIGLGQSPTAGDDVILGTNGPDNIDGLAGDDTICGLDGDDVLAGGTGNDTILGEGGNDTLKGQQNNDTLMGGLGSDLILGNAGDDVGFGGAGIDDLKGGSGVDTLDGGADDDEVRGGSGNDTLTGGIGNDVLNGGQDFDTVSGGIGNDTVNGAGSSDPSLNGDDGDDLVRGGNGGDTLNGGIGNDLLLGVLGADTLNGGPGNDDLRGGDGNDDVNGDAGDDDLRGGNGTDDCDGGIGFDQDLGGCETTSNIP